MTSASGSGSGAVTAILLGCFPLRARSGLCGLLSRDFDVSVVILGIDPPSEWSSGNANTLFKVCQTNSLRIRPARLTNHAIFINVTRLPIFITFLMKLALVKYQNVVHLALLESDGLYCVPQGMTGIPPDVVRVLQDRDIQSHLRRARNTGRLERLPEQGVTFLPPVPSPAKIVCVGLNYRDHVGESSFTPPRYPVFFIRFASGLVGHGEALLRPACSVQFDFEGELVAVIGKKVRKASLADALDAVAGYSIFNDATLRDYQLDRGPQWTLGKNFDSTAGFGPAIVSADELPKGAANLVLTTSLNGAVMQRASTGDLIFSVAQLIVAATEAFMLEPGDLLVTGTPSGVGFARSPPVFMKAGDIVEISIEGVGLLKNHILDAKDARAS